MTSTPDTSTTVSPTAYSFLERGEELLGYENYQLVGRAIWEGIQASSSRLPLLRKPDGYFIAITQVASGEGYVVGRANTKKNQFKLLVNAAEPLDCLLEALPEAIEHEIAHLAHSQQNPNFWTAKWQPLFLAGAICEGIAVYAGNCLDPDYYPKEVVAYEEDKLRQLSDGLIDVLYYPPADPRADYKDFIYGDDTFPNRGYEIGHYLVANAVLRTGASLLDLMQMPVDDFREVADKL